MAWVAGPWKYGSNHLRCQSFGPVALVPATTATTWESSGDGEFQGPEHPETRGKVLKTPLKTEVQPKLMLTAKTFPAKITMPSVPAYLNG